MSRERIILGSSILLLLLTILILILSPNSRNRVSNKITAMLDNLPHIYNNNPDLLPQITILPNPEIPQKVSDISKNTLMIFVEFFDEFSNLNLSAPRKNIGSGFCIKDSSGEKVIVTARHIFFNEERKTPLAVPPAVTSPNGLISYGIYKYKATAYSLYTQQSYQLAQIKIGRPNTEEDIMIFKVIGTDQGLIPMTFQTDLADKVYLSGVAPQITEYGLVFDVISEPLEGKISAIIKDFNFHSRRSKKLYRIRGTVEPGYSGGPALNPNGEVIGMSIAASFTFHFSYIIPAEILIDFINVPKTKNP